MARPSQKEDRAQLVPMWQQVEQNTGAPPEKVSADTATITPARDFLDARGISPFVRIPDCGLCLGRSLACPSIGLIGSLQGL